MWEADCLLHTKNHIFLSCHVSPIIPLLFVCHSLILPPALCLSFSFNSTLSCLLHWVFELVSQYTLCSNERFTNRSLSLCFSFFTVHFFQILFVLPAAKQLLYLSVCIAPSLAVCFSLGAQPGKWTATDEAPCLSAALEGINHNSVSALMRFQRCLFEIEPSGASDQSCTDSTSRQEIEPGIKTCLGPSPAFRH